MPSITTNHAPPLCSDLPHRNGSLRRWLRWALSTVRCSGRLTQENPDEV